MPVITDKPVLKKLKLRIDTDDRIALLGANGNGKSTLVNLIAERLPTPAGRSISPAICASAILRSSKPMS